GIALAFVIEEKIPFAAQKIGREWSAQRRAKAVSVIRGQRVGVASEGGTSRAIRRRRKRRASMIVHPAICSPHIGGEIVFINGTVELIRTTLRDHLHLAAQAPVEIGSLIKGGDF